MGFRYQASEKQFNHEKHEKISVILCIAKSRRLAMSAANPSVLPHAKARRRTASLRAKRSNPENWRIEKALDCFVTSFLAMTTF
jgi:hypothetical protein